MIGLNIMDSFLMIKEKALGNYYLVMVRDL